MKKGALVFWLVVLALIVAGIGLSVFVKAGPDNLGPFAKCLEERGAVFYGAFWCPHCARTKAMFGTAVDQLPYVECSTPDGQEQLPVCAEKEITSYPTWIFADGTRLTGERTLLELSEKTGCQLPAES